MFQTFHTHQWSDGDNVQPVAIPDEGSWFGDFVALGKKNNRE